MPPFQSYPFMPEFNDIQMDSRVKFSGLHDQHIATNSINFRREDDNSSKGDLIMAGIRGDSSSNKRPFVATTGISTVLPLRAGENTPTMIAVAASRKAGNWNLYGLQQNISNVSRTAAATQLTAPVVI
nr:uncharacterized protein LOC109155297 isoform X1 [Ipomoea batatas]